MRKNYYPKIDKITDDIDAQGHLIENMGHLNVQNTIESRDENDLVQIFGDYKVPKSVLGKEWLENEKPLPEYDAITEPYGWHVDDNILVVSDACNHIKPVQLTSQYKPILYKENDMLESTGYISFWMANNSISLGDKTVFRLINSLNPELLVNIQISNFTDGGNNQTEITTSTNHGFSEGDIVVISGTNDYDGYYSIFYVSDTVFKINHSFATNESSRNVSRVLERLSITMEEGNIKIDHLKDTVITTSIVGLYSPEEMIHFAVKWSADYCYLYINMHPIGRFKLLSSASIFISLFLFNWISSNDLPAMYVDAVSTSLEMFSTSNIFDNIAPGMINSQGISSKIGSIDNLDTNNIRINTEGNYKTADGVLGKNWNPDNQESAFSEFSENVNTIIDDS